MENRNSVYWEQRTEKQKQAVAHTESMNVNYMESINKCIMETFMYSDEMIHLFQKTLAKNEKKTEVIIKPVDSVSAIMQYGLPEKKMAVLNFASYKEPGGMFLKGSIAQEECLCHASFLYNVLAEKKEYYEWNRKNLNHALYLNRALYTPDVMFEKGEESVNCDVITCAAPNKTAAQMYCKISDETNHKVLESRIDFLLEIAALNKVDILILGAYGCGVFGQSPEEVAILFKKYIHEKYHVFEKVVFAIPKGNNDNYEKFLKYFNDEEENN